MLVSRLDTFRYVSSVCLQNITRKNSLDLVKTRQNVQLERKQNVLHTINTLKCLTTLCDSIFLGIHTVNSLYMGNP